MALKLQSLAYSTRILRWVSRSASISSTSCPRHVEDLTECIATSNDSSEFHQNINFLRNKLRPDNLIRVLDRTSDLDSAVKTFKWASQKSFRHSSHTYFGIIWKLGMAGNVQKMGALCQSMLKDRCPDAEEALLALIHTFVKHHRINEAMEVFRNLKNSGVYKPPVEVFNVLLGALVEESGDFQNALFVYKELVKTGILPTVHTLNYLLEALFMNNQVELALNQFRRMGNKGCCPNSKTFEILVKGLVAKNRVDEAISVMGEIFEQKYQLDMSFYSFSIPLLCNENKVEMGVRLFEMMKASDVKPDSLIYGDLVRCLCRNLHLDSAIGLINGMIESDISPSDDDFVDLVNCFCELGKVSEAIMFLDDKQVLETAPYNALLEGCCNAGNILDAYFLLDSMFERNIADCHSWSILVRCLCEKENIGKAFELLGKMLKLRVHLDVETYSALILGYCRVGKYEDAFGLFRRTRAKCWLLDSTSYSELLAGLCDIKNSDAAVEVFYHMALNRCSLHPSSYCKLIKCLCDECQVNKAINMWQLASCCGTSCCIDAHTTIMRELSKSGKAKDLLVVLSQMLVEGCNLDAETYCILIHTMSKQNQVKECVLFFNMMINEGIVPDPEGKKHEARRLLDLMLEKGWLPDATTHKLLVGSDARETRSQDILSIDNSAAQDTVSNILAEGLGET
ncbi:pentatricopeptide repeat-containing protein At1g12620-like isoform X2 [Arachis stenosperma]|uniref:pentatricopeptide repeat-containing protein At1g12620-like isoform X2 n=1 Tax=Arachis stenosperma TaxID=217475 RepID=UPI0025AD97F3|nr:pentatricopeptide repeat-containing protein At1g12620-like isoform X2 [Arachis stenosperma]